MFNLTSFPTYSDGSKPKIAIVGSGLSGINLSIFLKQKLNIHDFIVFEGEDDAGGTWKMNNYPGCGCDVNSHVYSYSYNLNPDWSKNYSGYEEIQEYLSNTVDKFDIRNNILFNVWVTTARFDKKINKWKLTYKNMKTGVEKKIEVDILVGGVGGLRIPNIPQDLTKFDGPWMHSAKWDHSVDLVGKKVGIIGSGASAVQIVPNIVNKVKELHTFQRTPPYVLPRHMSKYSNLFKTLLRYVPGLLKAYYWISFLIADSLLVAFYTGSWVAKLPTMFTRKYIKKAIKDPRKRELMIPRYHFGCKRITPSDTYYQAINKNHVQIHDGNIDNIEGKTLYLKDGTKQTVDVLILATGFKVASPYKDFDIIDDENEHIDSKYDRVGDHPLLNYGITKTGMPNFFMMLGPTTGLGHNSITWMIECQGNYICDMIGKMMKYDIARFELKPEVGEAYWQWVQKRVKPMVWYGNCKSWYQNSNGEVLAIWPGTCVEYYWKTKQARLDDYNCFEKTTSEKRLNSKL